VPKIPIRCFDRDQYPDEDWLKPLLHLRERGMLPGGDLDIRFWH